MPTMDELGREVRGPEGPLRITAMYAALPPHVQRPGESGRGRLYAEVADPTGGRWQAIIDGEDATLLESLDF